MLSNSPKVSVIIPCYNYGKFLDKAVNSILDQTFQDFEIIIVNDGSTDKETLDVLKNYQKPKTKVITIENQGVCVARNTGIELANGEYILPLDADDEVGRTYLEKAVKILDENSNVGIVCCKARFIGSKFWMDPFLNGYKFPDILLFNTIGNSSVFRKSDWKIAGGYNKVMKNGWEDYNFWLSIIALKRDVRFIPEPLFLYRQHFKIKSRNNSFNLQTKKNIYLQIVKNHEKFYQENIDSVYEGIIDLMEDSITKRQTINRLKAVSFFLAIFSTLAMFMLAFTI